MKHSAFSKLSVLGIFLVLFGFSNISQAATLVVDTDGKLLGADGVDVNGISYDVTFVKGRC